MSLDEIATPEGKRRYVRRLFATIADRYDLITVALSYGRDAAWKRRAVEMADVQPGMRVLDLACGTGDIALLAAERGCRVLGLDLTLRMLELAEAKSAGTFGASHTRFRGRTPPTFVAGDMLALPIAAASVDVVTTGYGLRNLTDLEMGLAEIQRVLKPGGVLVSLDFNRPSNAAVRAAYLTYLNVVGGALGWILHRDADTYRYIPASIRSYPGARGVAELMRAHGFADVTYYRVLGGLMALHRARKQ